MMESPRNAYGETLVELGKHNKNIVVLDCDLSCSTQTKKFADHYPDRFFNLGVAEQNMTAIATGLALSGKTVFASTFSMFASGRAWEQVRNSIAYNKANVKIVATHGGITVGPDGVSHQALEDIAIMRAIPEMVIIIPSSASQVKQTIKAAVDYDGPMFIRLTRIALPQLPGTEFKIGGSTWLSKGRTLQLLLAV